MSTSSSSYAGVTSVTQPEKFWIARENVVGTAHKNRSGEWVDFRPASGMEAYQDRTRLLAGTDAWVVRYYPAKGVTAETGETVYATTVSVEYVKRHGVIVATVTATGIATTNIVMDAPERVDFTHTGKVDGWPLPAEMQAEIDAAAAARESSWQAYRERQAPGPDAAVRAWAEALPAGSQERRWVQRWLRTGKAYDQVFRAACAGTQDTYRGFQIDAALTAFKKEVIGE